MSAHPNNTMEQKVAWIQTRKLGSRFIKLILSSRYFPETKKPSRRDERRIQVAGRFPGRAASLRRRLQPVK